MKTPSADNKTQAKTNKSKKKSINAALAKRIKLMKASPKDGPNKLCSRLVFLSPIAISKADEIYNARKEKRNARTRTPTTMSGKGDP